jgi:hypothetical protein
MTDLLIQLHWDITGKLNSEPLLQYNTILPYRKAVVAAEVQKRLPHLTPKNGKYGCGGLVNMATLRGHSPNVTPPMGDWIQTIDVIERPPLNFDVNGTMIEDIRLARLIRSALHGFNILGLSVLYQDDIAIQAIPDADQLWEGCTAQRVSFQLPNIPEDFYSRSVMPQIAFAGGVCTLTAGTAGDAVWFTTDGTFPGPGNTAGANGACTAAIYAAPFAAATGIVVRAAAWGAASLGSDVNQSTAP